MSKETKILRTKLLLLALDLDVQSVASEVNEKRETVSRVVNDQRPARQAREKVSELVAEKAKQLIAGEFGEVPA